MHNNMNETIVLPRKVTTSKAIEAALAHELNDLSPNDRTNLLEEIHCVKSMAVRETPTLVDDALEKLRHEASSLIGGASEKGYRDALVLDSRVKISASSSPCGKTHAQSSRVIVPILRTQGASAATPLLRSDERGAIVPDLALQR
jgi:hypothetical protein